MQQRIFSDEDYHLKVQSKCFFLETNDNKLILTITLTPKFITAFAKRGVRKV